MRCKLPEKPIMKHKRGLWSPDEDQKLTYYVMKYGHGCWSSVPINAGLQRNGKSCRLRWINYLRPGLKRGPFSSQEEEIISTLHGLLGNKWSEIARHLPGRTDNEIKNYWHCHLKKKMDKLKHVQVLFDLDNRTTSNMASIKSSPLSLFELDTPSLFELDNRIITSNFTNTSSADTLQSLPPVSKISNLPKLLFADWISLDEFQQDFGVSCDQALSHGSNYQVSTIEYNKESSEGCKNQNCLEKGSVENENMLQSLMAFDQLFEFNDGDLDRENFMYI